MPLVKDPEEAASRLFAPNLTARERAVFEAGVGIAALYHRMLGTPLLRDPNYLAQVKKYVACVGRVAPYKTRVTLRFIEKRLKKGGRHPYDYDELAAHHLDLSVEARYRGGVARARLRYIEELGYPLMYVERIYGKVK